VDGELNRSLIFEFCLTLLDQDDPKDRHDDQEEHA